jgi:hypothetical protein
MIDPDKEIVSKANLQFGNGEVGLILDLIGSSAQKTSRTSRSTDAKAKVAASCVDAKTCRNRK